MMNQSLSKIKRNSFNIYNYLFGDQYHFVIWSELNHEHLLHLEIISINSSFERNKTISGIHYDCQLDENIIFNTLLEIKNKYKILELVETNYKFTNHKILTTFIITKTDKLLFQNAKNKPE